MLDRGKVEQSGNLLEHLADSLDIPESRYQEAEERYKAVGTWLSKPDSPLAVFKPDIYPQGSFQLGTVVKPVTHEDEYDIDLVCQLQIPIYAITQQELKKKVGDRLKANRTYAGMMDEEGRRCWTLNYADSAKFHMDILPSIPDDFEWLLRLGVPPNLARYAIRITDKETWDRNPDWPRSNPKGYAEWFKGRMQVIFDYRRAAMARELRANIEDVPEFKVKTPLQRAIQILKRHRDVHFEKDPDDKPISIIISTLAAHAYNNEANLFDALISIAKGMPRYIMSIDEASWVPNPVNPQENFADKWQEHPQREVKFRKWLNRVGHDLTRTMELRGIHEVAKHLTSPFGQRAVAEAVESTGHSYRRQRSSGNLKMTSGAGVLGAGGNISVRDHTFYGE